MKIVLTRPHMEKVFLAAPPLGLGYLSSFLRRSGHEVELVDGHALALGPGEILQRCLGADMVGINCLTIGRQEAVQLSRTLKSNGLLVVLGGPHASGSYVELLEASEADFIVVGEGELSFLALIEKIEEKKDPRGLLGVFRNGEKRVVRRPLIAELDSIPPPDWEQMPPNLYERYSSYRAEQGSSRFRSAPILVSRGCPCLVGSCVGNSVWGKTLRYRSPENVVDEMESLVLRHGYTEVHIEDEDPVRDREWFEKFCRLLQDRRVPAEWGLTTANSVHLKLGEKFLPLMRKTGCYFLLFDLGKYADSPPDKDSFNTSFVGEKAAREMVGMSRKNGMITGGTVSVKLPPGAGEELERAGDSLEKFLVSLELDIVCINALVFGNPAEAEKTFAEFKRKITRALDPSRRQIIVQMLSPGTSFLDGDVPAYQERITGLRPGS